MGFPTEKDSRLCWVIKLDDGYFAWNAEKSADCEPFQTKSLWDAQRFDSPKDATRIMECVGRYFKKVELHECRVEIEERLEGPNNKVLKNG